MHRSSYTRWIVVHHAAAVIAGSGGNDAFKSHVWSYIAYLVHAHVVSTYVMLYWINRLAALVI